MFDQPFMKPANLHDFIGVVGLSLSFFSIWLTWILTRRDIKRRISDAVSEAAIQFDRRTEVIKLSFIRLEITELRKDLEEAAKQLHQRLWDSANMSLSIGLKRPARILASSILIAECRSVLTESRDFFEDLSELVRRKAKASKNLNLKSVQRLESIIRTIVFIEEKLQPHNTGVDHAQTN